MKKSVTVLGGDLRQAYLARYLAQDGWEVMTWGLEQSDASFAVSLDRALTAQIVILPLPVRRGEVLNLPLSEKTLSCEELWRSLRPEQCILGGMTGAIAAHLQESCGLTILDYYGREEVQIRHAAATAEGAIARVLAATQETLHGKRCLVIGYGRIGKLLAYRLHGMGAKVTAAARRETDLAWIESYGYRAICTGEIDRSIEEYDMIFNTVPSPVLDEACLARVRGDCLLIELASLPGGIDRSAAEKNGLHLMAERGIPGSVTPKSSARIIQGAIYQILREQGEEV